eukprot:TRINITY_DN56789_c0_g1_i1.p1 TRINITY_DN56789_c0_g1~~TRINITY_DN56789_c0_g1_i1.p1  ORF type:complete len:468 (+),score=59.44 TRINITY_DN56789_c0_g1_i1:43-1446(+)
MESGTALTFFVSCFGVQVFMAYNGGATQGTIDVIQADGGWTETSIGLLGSMDKIGMTVSSTFWGVMLSRYPAKRLLIMGLGINALSTFLFGSMTQHWAMLLTKLTMGFTEGLQWVWSQLWILAKVGEDPLFMNLSGASAGVGNLLGTVVAGFGTAQGLPYGFAFHFEACMLFSFLFAGLVFSKEEYRVGTQDATEGGIPQRLMQHAAEHLTSPPTFIRDFTKGLDRTCSVMVMEAQPEMSYSEVWNNALYRNSAIVVALNMYLNMSIQFMWIQLFTNLFSLKKQDAVWSLLLVPPTGAIAGAIVGSCFKIKEETRVSVLRWLLALTLLSVLGAGITMAGLASSSLWVCYLGLFVVFMGSTSTTGSLTCISSAALKDDALKSLGVGVQQTLVNFIGLALGPFLPHAVMGAVCLVTGENARTAPHLIYGSGALCCLAGTLFASLFSALALRAAAAGVSKDAGLQPLLDS